jgi:hypothetical protein
VSTAMAVIEGRADYVDEYKPHRWETERCHTSRKLSQTCQKLLVI